MPNHENQSDKKCRISNKELNLVLDFGMQPLGNAFLSHQEFDSEYFYPMKVGFCNESKMFQLIEQPEPKKMFHENYAFFSGTSKKMGQHFEKFSQSIINSEYFSNPNPFVVELGCNDGIMLKNFANRKISHLGVEPSKNVADEAKKIGINTLVDFFNLLTAKKILDQYGQADAILAANVMCHIPDIKNVVEGMKLLLSPKGIIVFEDPYLGDVITKTSYDQIYDEHVFLFSGMSIKNLFNLYDLELIDMEKQETHGGSMRYILAHKNQYPISSRLEKIFQFEEELGLGDYQKFKKFSANVEQSKKDLVAILKDFKNDGKVIAGYAATSKSTTILNYCNIGSDLIDYITDTTPIKLNKLTPGMHIPVVSYDHFLRQPPDVAVLFAWNHQDEILEKEKKFTESGGKWITHVPEVKVF